MFIFGKNKNKTAVNKEEDLKVHLTVIPEIFYGGKDPLIYYEQKVNKVEKKKLPEKQSNVKVVPPFSKKKVIIIILVLLSMIVGAGAWYYWNKNAILESEVAAVIPPGPKLPVTTPPVPTPPEPTPPVPTPPEPTPPVLTQVRPLTFPRILLKDSPDLDMDSLTDLEEEVFNTDSGVWDTDKDGYYDGLEISNLYNPTGFAPVKIVDSGLVREYINPTWKYRMYYPSVWEVASVDSNNDEVLFSSISGDFIEVRAIKNEASDSFDTWFGKNISGESLDNLTLAQNRFGVEFRKRSDSLVEYFVGDKVVFVVIYQSLGSADSLFFRHIMQMMYQSFRLGETSAELSTQNILPVPNEPIR